VNAVTPAAANTEIFDSMAQQHIDYMLSKIPNEPFPPAEERVADPVAQLEIARSAQAAVFDLSGGRATY